MATERFINLKDKKKQHIKESIRNCLEKNNLQDISIIDIAKEADISRGTFYTYFSDKGDCIYTFFKMQVDDYMEEFKNIVTKNGGDFFESIDPVYKRVRNFLRDDDTAKRINLSVMSSVNIYDLFTYIKNVLVEKNQIAEWCVKNTNLSKIYKLNVNQVKCLIEMYLSCLAEAIVQMIIDIPKNEVDNSVKFKFNLLKNSVINR